jgi:hypothetical protein
MIFEEELAKTKRYQPKGYNIQYLKGQQAQKKFTSKYVIALEELDTWESARYYFTLEIGKVYQK